jgi:hypothetical protein
MDGEAPPRYSLAVGPIGVPEAGFERTLLIKDDEQVKGGKNDDRVLEKVKTGEEPGLAEEEADDAVVHRVSGEAVKTGDDEAARRVKGGESAATCGKELPNAREENPCATKGDESREDRR